MDRASFDARLNALHVLNLRAVQDGKPVLSVDLDGEIRRNQYSVTKSFTSCAVGIAAKEGILSLDEKLTDAFADDLPETVSAHLAAATVRDLLTMCLGHARGYLMGEERPFLAERNWVKYALALPFDFAPGTHFQYDNCGPYLAGVLVQRRAGCTLDKYLQPRLFDALGIAPVTWETDPLGYSFGAGGLFLAVSELLRFGELLLNRGKIGGRQIIPEAYIDALSAKQAENGGAGYGYLFWRGAEDTYRADGKYGQYAIIAPKRNAVLAVNAECHEQPKLLKFLEENLDFIFGDRA